MSTNLKGEAENDMFCYEVLDKGHFDPLWLKPGSLQSVGFIFWAP